MEDKEPVKEAYAALDRALSDAGVSDSDKVGQYIFNRLRQGIDVNFSDEMKDEVIKYILKLPENIGLRELKKRMKPEEVNDLKTVLGGKPALLKQAIQPVEMVVHNFAVEVLKSVKSMFIVDNDAEVERQRTELANAVKQITEKIAGSTIPAKPKDKGNVEIIKINKHASINFKFLMKLLNK